MTGLGIAAGSILILIGFYGIIADRNVFKMVVGFSIVNTGIHLILVSLSYIHGGTAPIIDGKAVAEGLKGPLADPVPQALVLTAVVIGFGITSVMLVFVVRLFEKFKTLNIDEMGDDQ